MARKIAVSNLNASTIDILNTIRANAPYEYQQYVPEVTSEDDIVKVGDALYGYPSLANMFITALVNRIALVKVQSATFNNPYRELKKGYIENGETVEEIFTNIAKVIHFSYEKAPERLARRTVPDIRSAFHVINWRVMYPVSIDDNELRRAFLSMNGVQDLIARIVDTVYTANDYDEYLLFKYLIIKQVTSGKIHPEAVDTSDIKNSAKAFRGLSNKLTFMSTDYNSAGVMNTTPRDRQHIFMTAEFNAAFDVDVLAAAFNMDKADFMGKLHLIDSFDTFDNDRWAEIRAECDGLEEVTSTELNLMKDVQAVLVDSEFFQIYDYTNKFTEFYVGSGRYWNYWYHVDKAISASPFANAVVFVDSTATISNPSTINYTVTNISTSDNAIVYTLENAEDDALAYNELNFEQTQQATTDGVAIHKYGAVIVPILTGDDAITSVSLVAKLGSDTYTGTIQVVGIEADASADPPVVAVPATAIGDTITMTKQ